MTAALQNETRDPDLSIELLVQLANLTQIAVDEDAKRKQLWMLTEFYLDSADDFEDGDRDYFGDLMEEIAFSLERQVREDLARKIAAEACMPHALMVRLANDEIPVARPVLERSPVLNDEDLDAITRNRGQGHLLAITKREALSQRLTSVLAERGNQEVVESLLLNPQAKLAPDTIDLVAGRGRACERIQSALVLREDVPREVLLDLVKHASDRVRADIKRSLDVTDEIYLDEVVDNLKYEISSSRKSLARECIDELVAKNALNETALLRFLRDRKPMEFLLGTSRLFSVDVRLARRMIAEPSGQMLTIACRAYGICFSALKEMALTPITGLSPDASTLLELSRHYKSISEEDARAAMRALRLRHNMLDS